MNTLNAYRLGIGRALANVDGYELKDANWMHIFKVSEY
jgi:hypothetical protein